MIERLYIKGKDSSLYKAYTRRLDLADLQSILDLQEDILYKIKNKDHYCETKEIEYIDYFKRNDILVGIFTEENTLIAMGVLARYGICEENYGYSMGIRGDELLNIAQIDSVAVKENFRGNNLQKKICIQLENHCKSNNIRKIYATISPDNSYSIYNFLELGYKIETKKDMYGGLLRYILSKDV